jgi:hypothetical protein
MGVDTMFTRSALLLLALGSACCVAAQGGGVERRRGPWFCHRRSCPSFKTVSMRAGGPCWQPGAVQGIARRRQQLPAQLLRTRAMLKLGCASLPPAIPMQVREESEYSLRCYDRSTWAVSCAFDGEPGRRCHSHHLLLVPPEFAFPNLSPYSLHAGQRPAGNSPRPQLCQG